MNRIKTIRIVCFCLCIAAALYFPLRKVIQYEMETPVYFDFKVTGYDPYDPARGRYIALTVHPETVKHPLSDRYGTMYAVLGRDEKGLAKIIDLQEEAKTQPCLKVELRPQYKSDCRVVYPFRRFYINEDLAPAADRIFNEALQQNKLCTLHVQVYSDGSSAVEDLLVEGVSLRHLASEDPASKSLR